MGLRNWQIEHKFKWAGKPKAGERKWIRNQRNRKIRRTPQTQKPHIKYAGWEY